MREDSDGADVQHSSAFRFSERKEGEVSRTAGRGREAIIVWKC